LVDSAGSATTAQLSYAAGEYSDNTTHPFVLNGWHVRTVPNTADTNTNHLWDGSLVGYNDIGEISITVSSIPYSLYDVYVYAGANSVVSQGGMTVSDGVTSFSISSPTTATAPTSLTENTGSVSAYGVWQVFSGKTGSTFSLNTSGGFAYDATEVFALQIVNTSVVPEPATLALAGLGAFGYFLRRRR
jgi:PEP-CTERM motif